MKRTVKSVNHSSRIDGVIPGLRGHRAFPNQFLRTADPFVLLDQVGPEQIDDDFFVDGENSAHPHRGFETITFVFQGKMIHEDSLGNREAIKSGDIQRMNAGSGIQHGGAMGKDAQNPLFHEVQLWVNLPARLKMGAPEIQHVKAAEVPTLKWSDHASVRVISGLFQGVLGPINTTVSTQIIHLVADQNTPFLLPEWSAEYQVLIYVLEGELTVGGHQVQATQSVQLNNDGDDISLELKGQVLVLGGVPIQENVVMGGPFVMNSQAEIEQAFEDYNKGLFGNIK